MTKIQAEDLSPEPLPEGLDRRSIRRSAVRIAALLMVVVLVAALAPGLGELRERLTEARPAWLILAVALELLSCLSYVLMFKPVFCSTMSWRTAYELGMSELAIGSLVPASGAAGLAFGAWALSRGGMAREDIARRTVAFFVLKSGVNFVAVALIGIAMWLGAGPERSAALTLFPAVLALLAIGAVALIPWLVDRRPGRDDPKTTGWRRRLAGAGGAVADGVREAGRILRRGDLRVIAGSIGYWAFDNAVLWACLKAFGASPAISLVLMGYLIGQLGGLLPIPGGIGGIDGGLLGALVVYGLPAAATAAAILAYRVILFWLPLLLGGAAFSGLRKALDDPNRPDICDPFAGVSGRQRRTLPGRG